MAQLIRHVALVSEISAISRSDLDRAGAAIDKQVTRDFGPIWDVQATVSAFGRLEDVPLGYWPVMIREDIGQPGALGIHLDKDNQPFALVSFTDSWQLTASHEVLEMLADPFGNRVVAGDSPKSDQGRVEFLVEICDPSEAAEFGYTVDGILLSDFYTPNFFDPVAADGVRYSFTGAVTEPRQVLRGGYLSWHEPVSDHWWQEVFFDGQPEFRDLGKLTQQGGKSLRAQIDRLTEAEALKAITRNRTTLTGAARAFSPLVARPSEAKARALRAQIELLKASTGQSTARAEARQPEIRRAPRRGRGGEHGAEGGEPGRRSSPRQGGEGG